MEIREQAKTCLRQCQDNARDLRNLVERVPNQQAKNMFSHSAQLLEESIQQCQSAINQL